MRRYRGFCGLTVVRFKDGSSKEYSVSPKELVDFIEETFKSDLIKKRSGDFVNKMFDEDGESVVVKPVLASSSLMKFSRPVLDISDDFCRSHGREVVGHGLKTNAECGTFVKYKICKNVDHHHDLEFEAVHGDKGGLVFHHKVHHHCYNWRCPVCYFYGSAVREAQNIELRLNEASEKYHKPIEAGTVSLPVSLYSLSDDEMREVSLKALFARGWLGGNLIVHHFRYKSAFFKDGVWHMAGWFFAPHFHFLGFFACDYDYCRNCKNYNQWGSKSVRGQTRHTNHGGSACLKCDGFEGVTRRINKKDEFIVKVFSKRKKIIRTAMYELSHASFSVSTKRAHLSFWSGNCSYRKFEGTFQRAKLVCPCCKDELVDGRYIGCCEIVKMPDLLDYMPDMWLPMDEDLGFDVWVESEKGERSDCG